MAIFNCYVSSPEGIWIVHNYLWTPEWFFLNDPPFWKCFICWESDGPSKEYWRWVYGDSKMVQKSMNSPKLMCFSSPDFVAPFWRLQNFEPQSFSSPPLDMTISTLQWTTWKSRHSSAHRFSASPRRQRSWRGKNAKTLQYHQSQWDFQEPKLDSHWVSGNLSKIKWIPPFSSMIVPFKC